MNHRAIVFLFLSIFVFTFFGINANAGLIYSTYLGGSGGDAGVNIAVDNTGNAYITGWTVSSDFPTTPGVFDRTYNVSTSGGGDVFISKLNADGSALVFSTFLGGSGGDDGAGIAIDNSGNVYITGYTNSPDFPTTSNAFDITFNGSSTIYRGDAFVTKLNNNGSALIYSTFLGGNNGDYGAVIAVDNSGSAYIEGWTGSDNFPTTSNAYDRTYNGNFDFFVTKVNSTGTALVYSTYLGGSGWEDDDYFDIAIDNTGNAYVTGGTYSVDFPTTPGAFDITFSFNTDQWGSIYEDAFVCKLNSTGSALLYSTFLGGSFNDSGSGITIDNIGNAYITGGTSSFNFPISGGAYDTSYNGNTSSTTRDAFVTKLNPNGTGLVYSTFLGGSVIDSGCDIVVDTAYNAYITGYTNSSTDFPTTVGAIDRTYNGSYDVFVSKINSTGSTLLYSTYLGGSNDDGSVGISIDNVGNIYLVGQTDSSNFPTTTNGFDITYNGGYNDGFVSKLSLVVTPSAPVAEFYGTPVSGSDPLPVQFHDTSSGIPTSWHWTFGDGATSTQENPSHTYQNTGTYTVSLIASNTYGTSTATKANYIIVSPFMPELKLSYSTFLGGLGDDYGDAIAVDNTGNAYITGYTASSDFPTNIGTLDTTYNGGAYGYDVFVSKLNPSGAGLVYSTYLGGSDYDYGSGIVVDNSGNVYITGETGSNNFPTTSSAWDTSYNGSYDVFVSKLNPSGTGLVYSTYLGGSDYDYGYGITVDISGNTYITGYTNSNNFPTTIDTLDTSYNGSYDVFVSKLNPSGTGLVYSTYLGGSDYDYGHGITVDISGNTYITGNTLSINFPTTPSAWDTSYHYSTYGSDVFVSKLNPSGTGLVYSTYLGGDFEDYGHGIAVDIYGNTYITGNTYSINFPTTNGAWDTSFNGNWNCYDAFVSKLNPSGTGLVYSTYLGGSSNNRGSSIAVDAIGNAYVTGFTASSDFPTTTITLDTTYNSNTDVFVSKLNPGGTGLVYSTYLGGSNSDLGYGIALDASGDAYLTGYTKSGNFPTTAGAFDTLYNRGYDVFVSKLSLTHSTAIPRYLNSYGTFTVSNDTIHWLFEKYGDGISAGSLSWIKAYQCISLYQTPGQKGKLTQVFSVPSTGWYTAIARVLTDISNVAKQQKVYLYLQELDSSNAIVATGNQVIQSGAGGLNVGGWKQMQVSFYAQKTVLGIQVVGINPTNSNVTGRLYLDDIWVYAGGPTGTNPVNLVNPSFESGTTGWNIEVYADGSGPGSWSEWSGLLIGSQAGGEKGKASQLYSASTSNTLSSIWVYSASTSMTNTQKVYLYIYSYNNVYSTIIESGNAILQPGKWTPGQWRQLRFGYKPFTPYNVVQLVGINPASNPYQAIYFDNVELTQ